MIDNAKSLKRLKPKAPRLDTEGLRRLLRDAGRDGRAEAQARRLSALRPVLFDLMENRRWSSRRTACFLKSRGVKVKASEIDGLLKANPFGDADMLALESLKKVQPLKANVEGGAK